MFSLTTGCWYQRPEQQDSHEDPAEMDDGEKGCQVDMRTRRQRKEVPVFPLHGKLGGTQGRQRFIRGGRG